MTSGRAAARRYAAVVTAAGPASLVGFVALGGSEALRTQIGSPLVWVLGALLLIGELKPISISEESEVTTSTTFAFALLLVSGPVVAAIAQAVATIAADLRSRTAVWKIAFNAGQYALSLAGAGAVLWSVAGHLSGIDIFGPRDIVAAAAAGATFQVLNVSLPSVALALFERAAPARVVWTNLGLQSTSATALLALGPVVAVASRHSFLLLPLVGLLFAAIHRNTRVSVAKERQLQHERLHDAITCLPNRVLLRERIENAIADAPAGSRLVVLVANVDRFKDVNDTLGVATGDLLLTALARRFQDATNEHDVARLGADTYGILIAGVADNAAVAATAGMLRDRAAQPVRLDDDMVLEVDTSIGAALYPDHGHTADDLLQRAEGAMYEAKRTRSGFELYDPEIAERTLSRVALLGDLKHAIADGDLVLFYQPQLDLRGGTIAGVEALLRWQHPDRGLVPPADFVPLAEQTGLIKPLSAWVLRTAITQWKEWREMGIDTGPISVNISARNLHDPAFSGDVWRAIVAERVPPNAIKLEITESAVMADEPRAMATLDELAAHGLELSLDDFGTGHSSLARLRRIPVADIKIDRSFVVNMSSSTEDAMIVASMIDLGHNLGLKVVAEGVEDEETMRALVRAGCDYAQGFHICRPLEVLKLRAWLARSGQRPMDVAPGGLAVVR